MTRPASTARARLSRLAPASLRGRVVIAVLLLLAVLLVALFTAVDLVLGARLRADLRTRLTDRVALAQQLDGSLSAQQLVVQLRGQGVSAQLCAYGEGCVVADTAPAPPGAPADAGTLTRGPGSAAAGRPSPPAAPVRAATAVQRSGSTLFVRTDLADGQQLTLFVDDSAVAGALSRLLALEVAGGALTLVAAGLVLGRVVGVALGPLDRMTALARASAGGQRGARLGTGRPDTELGRTALAFDAMLDELEASAATARAAEARMRSFLADASHELRTPLAGLRATVENLLRRDPGRLEREVALAGAVRESARAARLVQDLLTATRLEEGVELQREPVDLAVLARQEVQRAAVLAPQLSFAVEGPSCVVDADPVRVGQVLTNLLDNARHAAPAGGSVRVLVGGPDGAGGGAWGGAGSGARGGAGPDGAVVVEVRDSGPGVPAADRERVFDRLVRLDASRSRASGGAGLGLPIARAIARNHGGDLVALEPVPGEGGARFRLVLPRGAPPAAPPPVEVGRAG